MSVIVNLDSLIDGIVTGNVNVTTANAAVLEAGVKAQEAEAAASAAEVSRLGAVGAKDLAEGARAAAETSAVSAETKASEAAQSAIDAGDSAADAGVYMQDAYTYKEAAKVYLRSVNDRWDDLDAKYLGVYANDPVLGNSGEPLIEGAMYFSTTVKGMRVYTGTTWADVTAATGALLIASNLSDVPNKAVARTNLDVYSRAETDSAVSTAVSDLVDSSPTTLDTLNELAAALGDDPNFATTVATSIGARVSKAGDTMTGDLTVPNLIVTGSVDGRDVSVDGTKLDGIEVGATADQIASEVPVTAVGNLASTNVQAGLEELQGDIDSINSMVATLSAEATKSGDSITISGDVSGSAVVAADGSIAIVNTVVADDSHTHDGRYYTEAEADSRFINVDGDTMTGDLTVPNLIVTGSVDGRDISVDGAKLDGIEAGATGDQTASEIKVAYESNANTNAFTDANKTAVEDTLPTDIANVVQSILALQSNSAQGEFGASGLALNLSSTEQVMPFTAITQSTDTTVFEIGTSTGTVKEAGNYTFISTVEVEDAGADGAVGTLTFNLRDTTTNQVYYTQTETVEISNNDRETIPFNSLMVIPDGMTLPATIDINVSCNITGYRITGFKSVLSAATSNASITTVHNTLVGRDTAEAHPASAISVVPYGNLSSTTVQSALGELQDDIDAVDTTLGELITGVLI